MNPILEFEIKFCVFAITGCCFVTFYRRKDAMEAQGALHNVKTLPGVSIMQDEDYILYISQACQHLAKRS